MSKREWMKEARKTVQLFGGTWDKWWHRCFNRRYALWYANIPANERKFLIAELAMITAVNMTREVEV